MADLTTLQYAQLLDGDDAALFPAAYSAVSSDPTVASIGTGPGGSIAVVAQSEGTVTITATRNGDGATATVDVTVEAAELGDFAVHLGTPAPKG